MYQDLICDPRCDLSWRMFCVHLRRNCFLPLSDGMSHKISITGKTKNTKAWRLNRISNRSLKTPKGIKNMQASDRKTWSETQRPRRKQAWELGQYNVARETRKISNKQSKLTPEATRERTKPQISRRKEIIKTRAEINERETKKTVKLNETKS